MLNQFFRSLLEHVTYVGGKCGIGENPVPQVGSMRVGRDSKRKQIDDLFRVRPNEVSPKDLISLIFDQYLEA